MSEVAHDPGAGSVWLRDVLEIRGDAQRRSRRSRTGDLLYRLYLLALLTLPLGYLLFGTITALPAASDAALQSLVHRSSVVAPVGLLMLAVAALRLASWTGPVVVARADIAWLLSLPLPRDQLTRPRLRRALVVAAVVGAAGGALATIPFHLVVGLGAGAGTAWAMAAVGAVGGACYLVLLAAVGWVVETRRRLSRAVMRTSGVVQVVLGGLLAAAALGPLPPPALRSVALASGPWGWLSAALLSVPGASVVPRGLGLLGMVLLLSATTVLAVLALRRAGDVPLAELARRAETSAQVTAAAVYFADFRSAAQARDRIVRDLVGRSRRRLPRPRRAPLIVPWISASILRRQPRRLGQALLWLLPAVWVLARGLAALGASDDGLTPQVLLVPLAAALAYGAAGTLVEPLRVEVEQRFGVRMLPLPLEVIGLWHLLVPAVALWVLTVLAAGLLATVGWLAPGAVVVTLVAGPPAAAVLVGVAGMVAAGPPADSGWLYGGDAGLARLVLHLLRGPLLSVLVVAGPILLAARDVGDPAALPSGIVSGALWSVASVAGLARLTQSRLRTHH